MEWERGSTGLLEACSRQMEWLVVQTDGAEKQVLSYPLFKAESQFANKLIPKVRLGAHVFEDTTHEFVEVTFVLLRNNPLRQEVGPFQSDFVPRFESMLSPS